MIAQFRKWLEQDTKQAWQDAKQYCIHTNSVLLIHNNVCTIEEGTGRHIVNLETWNVTVVQFMTLATIQSM